MSGIEVRLAQNEDGDTIHDLLHADGLNLEGLDWHDIYPHWLVAEIEEKIVGCVEVLIGKPIGKMEFLATDDALSHRDRACVVKELFAQVGAVLKIAGVQMVSGSIPFEMKAYKRVVKRRGGVVLYSGNTFIKRIA